MSETLTDDQRRVIDYMAERDFIALGFEGKFWGKDNVRADPALAARLAHAFLGEAQ